MKDMQVHLEKIRSDAAECLVLSNLANEGKRELFVRMAEHLNGLALEVEKAMAAERANVAYPTDHVQAVAADHEHTATEDHKQAVRSRWVLPWLSVIVLVAVAGTFFWVNNRIEDTKLAIAALLTGEQEARKVETQHLGAIGVRVDGLERMLDILKGAGVEIAGRMDGLEKALGSLKRVAGEIAGPSNKQEEKPLAAETKRSAPEELPIRAEEKHTSTLEKPAAAE